MDRKDWDRVARKYYENDAKKVHRITDLAMKHLHLTDKDEYYSLTDVVFTDVLRSYNPDRGNFDKFLYFSFVRRFETHLTYNNRDIRMQYVRDKNGNKILDKNDDNKPIRVPVVYLDAPLGEDEDSGCMGDFVEDKHTVEDELFEGKYNHKINAYMKSLSHKQQKIVRLICAGYKHVEIRNRLGMTQNEYSDHISSIKAQRNISKLY